METPRGFVQLQADRDGSQELVAIGLFVMADRVNSSIFLDCGDVRLVLDWIGSIGLLWPSSANVKWQYEHHCS